MEKARRLAETRQVPPKVVRPAAAPVPAAAAAFKPGKDKAKDRCKDGRRVVHATPYYREDDFEVVDEAAAAGSTGGGSGDGDEVGRCRVTPELLWFDRAWFQRLNVNVMNRSETSLSNLRRYHEDDAAGAGAGPVGGAGRKSPKGKKRKLSEPNATVGGGSGGGGDGGDDMLVRKAPRSGAKSGKSYEDVATSSRRKVGQCSLTPHGPHVDPRMSPG